MSLELWSLDRPLRSPFAAVPRSTFGPITPSAPNRSGPGGRGAVKRCELRDSLRGVAGRGEGDVDFFVVTAFFDLGALAKRFLVRLGGWLLECEREAARPKMSAGDYVPFGG